MKKPSTKSTAEKVQTIAELQPDQHNLRKHGSRNIGMLVDSLHAVGAARSIVIDEENTVLAGNGVLEAAGEAGITKLQVVEADGETVIAVRRRGLTVEQKKKLALYDNRVAELSEWDVAALCQNTQDLIGLFTPNELDELVEQADHKALDESQEEALSLSAQLGQRQLDLSPRLHEAYHYVVLLFRNDIDWAAAMDHFKLKPVQDPTNSKIGIGRVLEGVEYLREQRRP